MAAALCGAAVSAALQIRCSQVTHFQRVGVWEKVRGRGPPAAPRSDASDVQLLTDENTKCLSTVFFRKVEREPRAQWASDHDMGGPMFMIR